MPFASALPGLFQSISKSKTDRCPCFFRGVRFVCTDALDWYCAGIE
jgi:hypothetical protein